MIVKCCYVFDLLSPWRINELPLHPGNNTIMRLRRDCPIPAHNPLRVTRPYIVYLDGVKPANTKPGRTATQKIIKKRQTGSVG